MDMEQTISSDEAMKKFGETLAAQLRGGQVIELIGDVGAGKTTLAKGVARGLGITEELQSPSFTLSRVYDMPDSRQLVHYDFYRLSDPGILADELVDTMGRDDVITLIEWADIVEGVLPEDRITIQISPLSEAARTVRVNGATL